MRKIGGAKGRSATSILFERFSKSEKCSNRFDTLFFKHIWYHFFQTPIFLIFYCKNGVWKKWYQICLKKRVSNLFEHFSDFQWLRVRFEQNPWVLPRIPQVRLRSLIFLRFGHLPRLFVGIRQFFDNFLQFPWNSLYSSSRVGAPAEGFLPCSLHRFCPSAWQICFTIVHKVSFCFCEPKVF